MSVIEYTTKEIQGEADRLLISTLTKAFKDNNLEINDHEFNQKREIGIDYNFEVCYRNDNKHLLMFYNQNKGKGTVIKPLKAKNVISFQLSLRHFDYYYYELEEPVLFTYCDIQTKKIYWYCIQNDSLLEKRVKEKKAEEKSRKKTSIQIYIPVENVINESNIYEIIEQLRQAKENQLRRNSYFSSEKADYSKLENIYANTHLIDGLFNVIKKFTEKGVTIIPKSIIKNILPNARHTLYHIPDSTLETNNFELFQFFSDLKVSNGEYVLKNKSINVELQNIKLKTIVQFFEANRIRHIKLEGNVPHEQNHICIHELFNNDICNCERCSFEQFNFLKARQILNETSPISITEKLRKGYTYYLMEDYKNSYLIFYQIYNDSNETDPISYVIAKFNLLQLKNLIYPKIEDLNQIENFNLSDEKFIKNKAPYFIDIYNRIKDYNHIFDLLRRIDNILTDIIKISHNDKFGGWTSYNKLDILLEEYQNYYFFIEYNNLIFNYYSEHKIILKKVFEAIIALHNLKNPLAKKYEAFPTVILRMWISHIPHRDIRFILSKYNTKKIKISDEKDFCKVFIQWIDNLIESKNIYTNDDLHFKVENSLNNMLIFISLADISDHNKNKIIIKILKLLKVTSNISISYISLLLEHTKINKQNLKGILDFVLSNNRIGISTKTKAISYYVDIAKPKEIKEFILKYFNSSEIGEKEIFEDHYQFETISYAITLLNKEEIENIEAIILKKLSKEFFPELYSMVTTIDLIKFNQTLFNKFLNSIQDMSDIDKPDWFRLTHNYRLNDAINIIFKYNLKIDESLKKLYKKAPLKTQEYYKWLLNLDDYDYSNFNAYWLLEYRTKYYLKAFKKSENFMNAIRKSLKENYIEGVAKLYFESLC